MTRLAPFTRLVGNVLLCVSLCAGAAASPAGGADGAQLNALQASLTAAEGVRAVKRLQHSYAHYLTDGLWGEAAALFTADVSAQFGDVTVHGSTQLRRQLRAQAGRKSRGLDRGQLNAHLTMQPIVTLGADGRTARATWHEVRLLGHYGVSASWEGGIYENEYQLQRGVWRISRLRYFPQYSGAYSDWGHKAPARWDVPYHFDSQHVGVTIPRSALQALAAPADGEPSMSLEQIARRAQRLADETQVADLQHAFGYYLDRKLWDDVADLFTDTGRFEVAPRGSYRGRERIRRALETFHGAPPLRRGELFDHIMLSTVVTIAADGRRARARSLQLSMLGLDGQYARWELGVYENEFQRDDGVWKIQAVHYYPTMATDYEDGWAKKALPAAPPSAEFPPDTRSAAFASYPQRQPAPLRYPNPVTGRAVQPTAGGKPSVPLQQAIDAAIAVDAVENLNSSYGYFIDESAWDDMANTFASTGSKELTGAGVYVGTERIRKVLKLRGPLGGRTPGFFTIHQLTQPVIHVAADGSSANARLRLFQLGGNADGSSGSWIGGTYENTAVFENGEWKFGRQDLHHSFNASYRNGWARFAKPASGGMRQGLGGASSAASFATQMPPDGPIRARQYSFPEIVEPAFHDRNPVSGRMPVELLP